MPASNLAPPEAHPSHKISGNREVRVDKTRYRPNMYLWAVDGWGNSCIDRLLSHLTYSTFADDNNSVKDSMR
jgi:hypothetical protein